MQSENPYAPPASQDVVNLPVAPLSSGWHVKGKAILVTDVCILPMVDLLNGKTEDMMTMHWVTVHLRPAWLWAIPVLCALLALFLIPTDDGLSICGGAVIGFCLGLIPRALVGRFLPRCALRAFSLTASWRRRNLMSNVVSWLGVFIVVTGLLPFAPLKAIAGVGIGLLILRMLYVALFQRRLACRRKVGDAFEIRGVHPKALRQLAEIQARREKQALHADVPL